MSQDQKQKKSKKSLVIVAILVLAVCAILAQCAVRNTATEEPGEGKGTALVTEPANVANLEKLLAEGATLGDLMALLAELEEAAKTRELTPEEQALLEQLRALKKTLDETGYGKGGPLDSMLAAGATVQDLMNRLAELEEAARTRELTAKEKAELEALRKLREALESASPETMGRIEKDAQAKALEKAAEQARLDSLAAAARKKELTPEERATRDSLKRLNDSLAAVEKLRKDSLKQIADSLRADSLARAKEAARIADSLARLAQDSIPPTVSLTPPPGRYYEPIKLKAKCDEIKCNSWISVGDTLNPQEAKKGIDYNKSGIVFFRAQDSAGNYSEWQTGEYNMASDNKCGKYSYPVPVGGKEVCVDAYEYPNKPEEVPRDMVSHAQAASLCEAEGKRLCTIDEWKSACMGRETQRYSYGNSYIASRCNTNTSAALRTGRRTQCRSWWGMYDMNGNLWEWTATPAKEKAGSFLAAGGSWSGNNQTRCTEASYSFYTQNQYPSVGFRCCKDSP